MSCRRLDANNHRTYLLTGLSDKCGDCKMVCDYRNISASHVLTLLSRLPVTLQLYRISVHSCTHYMGLTKCCSTKDVHIYKVA